MTDKILVFVTCSSLIEGETIARALIDKQLAACASVGARVRSYYVWKGERQEANEYPLTLKTTLDKFPELESEVRRLHSYEVPEIVAVRLEAGSNAYLQWIDENLRLEAPRGVWGAGHETANRTS